MIVKDLILELCGYEFDLEKTDKGLKEALNRSIIVVTDDGDEETIIEVKFDGRINRVIITTEL